MRSFGLNYEYGGLKTQCFWTYVRRDNEKNKFRIAEENGTPGDQNKEGYVRVQGRQIYFLDCW